MSKINSLYDTSQRIHGFYGKERKLSNYSGKVKFFDSDGNSLGKIIILEGQRVPIQIKQSTQPDVLNCTLDLDYIFCVGNVNGGSGLDCTYYYTLECQSSPGAGRGDSSNDWPESGSGGLGGSGNWEQTPTG